MKSTIILTDEKFKEIYTSEQFRNQVAYAHQHCNSNGVFIEFITCSYPVTYIVTPEQIEEAKKECERAKIERINGIGNKLVFVGMGMDYLPRYEGDPANHRIRTEFKNIHGNEFFIEVGTNGPENMRIDFAIDRTMQKKLNDEVNKQSQFYNYHGLERSKNIYTYTKERILSLVNREFDCKFIEMEVDNYNLSTDDFICQSPK